MEDCIFCKIAQGDIPSEAVYEDESTYAFLDNKPVNKGHTLVVPKRHVRNMLDAEPDMHATVYSTAQNVARAQMEVLDADGVNISNNNEPAAGQEVFHYHVHVIPRFEGDGLSHWPKVEYEENEISEFGARLARALQYSS